MTLIKQNFSLDEIVRSSTLLASSGVVAKGIVTLRSLYLLHSITVYEYGVFRLILSLVSIFQTFLFSGLDGVIENDIAIEIRAQKQERAAKLFFEFAVFRIGLSFVLWGAFYIFVSFFIGRYYDANTIFMLKIASSIIVLTAVSDVFSTFFAATAAMNIISKTTLVFEAMNFALLFSLFFFRGPNVSSLLMSIIAFRMITLGVYWLIARKDIRKWWAGSKIGRPFLIVGIVRTYGKWAIFSNIGSELLSDGRDFIIKYLFSTEAVGLYNFAKGLISQLGDILPLKRIGYMFGPYKISRESIRSDYFLRGVKTNLIISLCVMTISYFGGTFLIKLFLPKYLQALPLFYVMIAAGFFGGITYMTDVYMYVLRYQRILFFRTFLKSALSVALLFVLAPMFGILALGLEYVITSFLLMIVLYRTLVREIPELKFGFTTMYLITVDDLRFMVKLLTDAFRKNIAQLFHNH